MSDRSSRSGLSLYANLLGSDAKHSTSSTISSGPVLYGDPTVNAPQPNASTADKSQISSAALRFQPTKRPQLSSQKPKTKLPSQRPLVDSSSATSSHERTPNLEADPQRASARTTLLDWTNDAGEDDVNGFYAPEKRQRGGRKKRKKNRDETHLPRNWDDIYDPSRPNVYEEYKASDEKYLEIREWKDKLYAHRFSRRRSSDSDSDSPPRHSAFKPQFAPPASLGAVKSLPTPPGAVETGFNDSADNGTPYLGLQSNGESTPALHPPVTPGIESQPQTAQVPPPAGADRPPSAANISRAPVRYNLPAPPPELPATEAELEAAFEENADANENQSPESQNQKSRRPGQQGFAERLMSKYGWTKGTGLGASGTGMKAPLRVQLDKQKKKPDSEGGGFVGPGGMGRIIGGQRQGKSKEDEAGKFGAMSEVIILKGMLDGMNIDEEMGAGDGGLMQEIGDECGEKYGRVERVFVDRNDAARASVFVKFTSQLSALRAVNALEGRIFNGNCIAARFFDTEKFDAGIYQ